MSTHRRLSRPVWGTLEAATWNRILELEKEVTWGGVRQQNPSKARRLDIISCGDGDRTCVICEELDQISILMETGDHLGEWNQLEVLVWTHSYEYCVFIGRWRNNHKCECGHVLVCMVTKDVHLEGLETGLSLSYSPSGSTSVLSAMRQTETALLTDVARGKRLSCWHSCPVHIAWVQSQGGMKRPLRRNVPVEQDYWLVTFKSIKVKKVKECQKTAWRIGFSTFTMWSPGIQLRLLDLTASLCPVNHPPSPQYVLWATWMECLVSPLYSCRKNI